MSDETDTTGEVARVLNLHASFKASAEIQDPNTPWYWECDGCDARLALSGTYGRPEVVAALAKHQAAMLAEAGLLATGEHLAWERGYTWGHNDSQNGTETRNPYPVQIAAPVPAEEVGPIT